MSHSKTGLDSPVSPLSRALSICWSPSLCLGDAGKTLLLPSAVDTLDDFHLGAKAQPSNCRRTSEKSNDFRTRFSLPKVMYQHTIERASFAEKRVDSVENHVESFFEKANEFSTRDSLM
jgi:hypothetical protein